jgi:diguanylate cyclase (GGDEF)-like protein
MLGQSAASLVADASRRKGWRKVAFNIGQYWVAWGLAGLVFEAVSGDWHLTTARVVAGQELAAMFGAALTYFLVNSCLVGAVVALNNRLDVVRNIGATLAREVTSDWVLLALAPVVFVVAERSVILLPLLLLPVVAVYRSASVSIEKDYQASHDSLTDLPNRLSFTARLEEFIRRSKRQGTKLAVVLIDLDRFKEVNDTLGHQAGDALLCQIGIRIGEVAPQAGIVARFGGDEFAVLFDGIADGSEAVELAAAIVEGFAHPFQLDDFRLDVEASAGVALYPDHGSDDATLLQHADTAMYVAKANHGGVELYDARKDHHSRRRLGLLGELRTALRNHDIVLHYQPKLDLVTARVETVEALVRWQHPEHGLIPPTDFVPLAERTGLIRPLTTYVMEEAIAQARRWLDRGLDIPVAVNLSARNLYDTQLPEELAAMLDRWNLPAKNLHLEITESSIMADPSRARRILTALDAMGLRVVIDDFGTGYSSLAYLQRLPVSEIKVDRSFVLGMVHNDSDHIIVRSTIELARNLGLDVTAEGVETEAALRLLRATDCNAAQGYFISRPVPAAELEAWMDAGSQPQPPGWTDARAEVPPEPGPDVVVEPDGRRSPPLLLLDEEPPEAVIAPPGFSAPALEH